jgi:outer membrane protein OmpA-like peptidoglycan-associated protein
MPIPRELSRAARLALKITLGGAVGSACGADAEHAQTPAGTASDSTAVASSNGAATPTTSVSAGPSASPTATTSASAAPTDVPRRVVPIYGASEILILDRIYFETGSTAIRAQYEGVIDAVGAILIDIPQTYLRCVGHALPTEPKHEALAKARAKVVCDRLVKRGIEPKRLTVVSEPIDEAQLKDLSKEALERLRATTFQVSNADGSPIAP